MRRGEVWTASGGSDYAGKPRPVVIIQSDDHPYLESVTVCALTSLMAPIKVTRPTVQPSDDNGLVSTSQLMVDKLTTLPKRKLGQRIGQLADTDMLALNRAVAAFLGLTG
jgi:mRNA interferase MazF